MCLKKCKHANTNGDFMRTIKKSKHFTTTTRPSQYLRAPHLMDGMLTFSIGEGTAARERSTGFSNTTIVRCALHNVSGIAVDTLLVGYKLYCLVWRNYLTRVTTWEQNGWKLNLSISIMSWDNLRVTLPLQSLMRIVMADVSCVRWLKCVWWPIASASPRASHT